MAPEEEQMIITSIFEVTGLTKDDDIKIGRAHV